MDPGDIEAQVSQGAIAVHAAEHRGTTDRGVLALRRALRQGVRTVANGERLNPLPSPWPDGVIPTYGHDTVLEIPPWHGDESERLDALAKLVHGTVIASANQPRAARAAWVETSTSSVSRLLSRRSCTSSAASAFCAAAEPAASSSSRLHGQVMAQGVMVVEVLVAQRDPEHPLAQHVHKPVPHLAALAIVRQASSHRRRQIKPAIRLAQQHHPAIARRIAAVKNAPRPGADH